jgi:hypothetical protein
MIVLLDAGPLGLISNPKAMELANECREWMRGQSARGVRFCLPEMARAAAQTLLERGELFGPGSPEFIRALGGGDQAPIL